MDEIEKDGKVELFKEETINDKLCLTDVAKRAQGFEIFNVLEKIDYKNKERLRGLNTYINLINKLEKINKNLRDDKKIKFYDSDTDEEITAKEVKARLEDFYYVLKMNKSITAAEKDSKKRRKQYDKFLNGFKILSEVLEEKLKEGTLDFEQLAGNLSTISNLSKVCAGGWMISLNELMTIYAKDIQKKIGMDTSILFEKNKLKQRLNVITQESIKKVVDDVIATYLERIVIDNRPHFKLICMDYLNKEYNFKLPMVMDFDDSYIEKNKSEYNMVKDFFEKCYIKDLDLERCIINDILITYEDILNRKIVLEDELKLMGNDVRKEIEKKNLESMTAKNELVDNWVALYYGKDEKKELDNWGSFYIKNYELGSLNEVLSRSSSLTELIQNIKGVIESDIKKCNDAFLDYCNQNNQNGKLLIGAILEDKIQPIKINNKKVTSKIIKLLEKSTDEKDLEDVIKSVGKEVRDETCEKKLKRIKEQLKNSDNEKRLICGIKNIVIGNIKKDIEDIKSGYNSIFLTKYVYDDEYRIREVAIKQILKDSGYLETVERDINEVFFEVCARSDKYELEFLLKGEKEIDINMRNKYNETPLHIVCLNYNSKNIVEFLLENFPEIDVNAKDKFGSTPLHFACEFENKDVVELLLEYKADVNVFDYIGVPPIVMACFNKNKDIVELLLKHGAKTCVSSTKRMEGNMFYIKSPLYIACEMENKDIMKLLLKYRADVNEKYITGETPLYVACIKENEDIVKLLLEYKADVNVIDLDGRTPIYEVCSKNKKNLFDLLIDKVNDENMNNSIIFAYKNEDIHVVDTLLKYETRDYHVNSSKKLIKMLIDKEDTELLERFLVRCYEKFLNLKDEKKIKDKIVDFIDFLENDEMIRNMKYKLIKNMKNENIKNIIKDRKKANNKIIVQINKLKDLLKNLLKSFGKVISIERENVEQRYIENNINNLGM